MYSPFCSPLRYFIELRGVGIINAKNIFGIGAVKMTEKINMIIDVSIEGPFKVDKSEPFEAGIGKNKYNIFNKIRRRKK